MSITSSDASFATSAFALPFPFPREAVFAFVGATDSGSRDAARLGRVAFRVGTGTSTGSSSSPASCKGDGERLRDRFAFALVGLNDGPAAATRPFDFAVLVGWRRASSSLTARKGVVVLS